jgi:hypothetical protein
MQGTQVLPGASNHARNCGHRFQDNRAVTVTAGKKSISEETRRLGESQRKPIGKIIGDVMLLQRNLCRHSIAPLGLTCPSMFYFYSVKD